jgi:hypothetical protein
VSLIKSYLKGASMKETNLQSDELLQALAERLNRRLMDEAQSRQKEVERGLETAELGGLIVQKLGSGMDAAVQVLGELLNIKPIGTVQVDAATEKVDPQWRENMASRWKFKAGIDRSTPRSDAN